MFRRQRLRPDSIPPSNTWRSISSGLRMPSSSSRVWFLSPKHPTSPFPVALSRILAVGTVNLQGQPAFKGLNIPTREDGTIDPVKDLFRTDYPGVTTGPVVSQLLLADFEIDAVVVEPRQVALLKDLDYMTSYQAWLDVQVRASIFTPPPIFHLPGTWSRLLYLHLLFGSMTPGTKSARISHLHQICDRRAAFFIWLTRMKRMHAWGRGPLPVRMNRPRYAGRRTANAVRFRTRRKYLVLCTECALI